jgi:hypothetical protein
MKLKTIFFSTLTLAASSLGGCAADIELDEQTDTVDSEPADKSTKEAVTAKKTAKVSGDLFEDGDEREKGTGKTTVEGKCGRFKVDVTANPTNAGINLLIQLTASFNFPVQGQVFSPAVYQLNLFKKADRPLSLFASNIYVKWDPWARNENAPQRNEFYTDNNWVLVPKKWADPKKVGIVSVTFAPRTLYAGLLVADKPVLCANKAITVSFAL